MKKQILKSKNFIAKIVLTILGFTLAASQVLAQYMAIRPIPKPSILGKLVGVTDTISRFMIVINNQDTLYSSWQQKYKFYYSKENGPLEYELKITDVSNNKDEYYPVNKIIAIKPEEDSYLRKEIEIELKKKDE
jgi:hypothetical protein